MLITRISALSGKEHTLDVPCTFKQLDDWQAGIPIQVALAGVSAELREFVLSGITPEEWNVAISDYDEE